MAFILADRVKETTATTGAGTISLAGAPADFQNFVAGIGNGNSTCYGLVSGGGGWEIGIGTVTDATPDTLTRTTILASSNGGAAINLSGISTVWCDDPARKTAAFFRGSTSGTVTVQAAAVAGTNTITLPAATGTLPTLENAQTWGAGHTWNAGGNTSVKIGQYGGAAGYNFVSLNGDLTASGAGIIGGNTGSLGNLYIHAPTQIVYQVSGFDAAIMTSSIFSMVGTGEFDNSITVDGITAAQASLYFQNSGTLVDAIYRAASSNDLRFWSAGFGDAVNINYSTGIAKFLGGIYVSRNTSNAFEISNGGGTSLFTFAGNNSIISTAPSARSDGTNLVFNAKTNGGLYINNDITGGVLIVTGLTGLGGFPGHQLQLAADDGFKPNGGSWGNSSDARIKKNVIYRFDALLKIRKLKPALFDWINPQDHGGIAASGGFIAQDMMQVFPQFVTASEPTETDKKLIPQGEKSFDLTLHNSFFGYLTKAIQELDVLVSEQKNTIEILTARITLMEKKPK